MEYWEGVWDKPNVDEYIGYVKGYAAAKPAFLDIFAAHGVKRVCDAACGFGAYSVMLQKNGYVVDGFDISANSLALTKEMLRAFHCQLGEYKVCSITDINYPDGSFDGVVAHAVIDHLSLIDARAALEELYRIVRPGGLLYLSFDALTQDDISNDHQVLEDGSYLYGDGLLFHYYTNDEIHAFLNGKTIVYENTNAKGDRELVLQKE